MLECREPPAVDPLRARLECVQDTLPVMQVRAHERQRINKQVREEDDVHDDVVEDVVIVR